MGLIITDKCIGCNKCVPACPFGALSMQGKRAVADDKCTLCGACVPVCPVKAISIEASAEGKKDLSQYKSVWVFCEYDGQTPKSVSYELLSEGRKLANELGENLCAVVLSAEDASQTAKELAGYGADKVYFAFDKHFAHYNCESCAQAMTHLINKYKPSVVLYPSTYVGRDIAPRVAAKILTGLTADCTGLSIKNGLLLQTRPAFGGNIMADIISPNHRPQMATVRPGVMKRTAPDASRTAEVCIEKISINPADIKVKVIETKKEKEHANSIKGAKVIVSGGKGMKDKKGFALLKDLADALGGSVGGSRAAVEMGLIEKPSQVGQSGETVAPKLYIACGISGAIQHIVGMDSSDVVIAVNKDPKAPIFSVCKYALVGNAHEIVTQLIKTIKEKK